MNYKNGWIQVKYRTASSWRRRSKGYLLFQLRRRRRNTPCTKKKGNVVTLAAASLLNGMWLLGEIDDRRESGDGLVRSVFARDIHKVTYSV